MKRRSFLKLGLFGGAVLAAGGVGLGLWGTAYHHRPQRKLFVLDEQEFAILAAAAACIVRAPGADPASIAHRIDANLSDTTVEAARDFKRLLGLIENALVGLVLDGRPRPFTHLDLDAREAALFRYRDSRLALRRSGYQSLRKLCLIHHYAEEHTWAGIGYPGPPTIDLPPDYKVPD